MRRTSRAVLLSVVFAVFAVLAGPVGCGDDEPVVSGPDGAGGGGTLGGGRAGLAVLIEHVGGYVPPERLFARLPMVAVYDDGRSLTQGAVAEIYPGPAVPPVVEGALGEEQLAELEDAAAEAGLLEGHDRDAFGEPAVVDLPDTRITVVVDGREVVNEVAALGFDEGTAGGGPAGEQAERRAAAERFVQLASDLATAAEGELFEPDRYRVEAQRYRGGRDQDPSIRPNRIDWPAGVALEEGECIPVTGPDAEALAEALPEATEITRWTDDGGDTWRLSIRPVLPHEPDC